jgi:hypothetical protein
MSITKPTVTEIFQAYNIHIAPTAAKNIVHYVALKSIQTLVVLSYSWMDSNKQSATVILVSLQQLFSVIYFRHPRKVKERYKSSE